MNRIKELRKLRDITQEQLAKYLSVAQSTLSGWESGKFEIDNDHMFMLADYFNVTVDYLLGSNPETSPGGTKIPVLGSVAAGVPIDAITDIIGYEDVPPNIAMSGDYFALRIKGDSMAPIISDGCTVIVRKQASVEHKEVAVVLVNGSEATVKEINFSPAGITLVGWNHDAYTPHFYTNEEINRLPVQILGRVVEIRRKL